MRMKMKMRKEKEKIIRASDEWVLRSFRGGRNDKLVFYM